MRQPDSFPQRFAVHIFAKEQVFLLGIIVSEDAFQSDDFIFIVKSILVCQVFFLNPHPLLLLLCVLFWRLLSVVTRFVVHHLCSGAATRSPPRTPWLYLLVSFLLDHIRASGTGAGAAG